MKTKKTRPQPTSVDRTTAYAAAVVDGRIVAGPHVRNACRRHLKDLEDGHERGLRFDTASAARAFGYFEDVLRLSEGQFEGERFTLEPSQAFIVGSIFGWKRADGFRRFRRAYVEEGKGNGKSPLAGGIGLIGMTADDEPGAEVYAAAAKRDQAQILFRDAVKMVKAAPYLKRKLRLSGGDGRENNIAFVKTGSFFRPVSREAGTTGSGPRPHFVLADEIHELPSRAILETLERGFKFRRQPLILMITNSGSDRNSICWEEHEHAIKVAAGNPDAVNDPTFLGEALDDSTFAYVCSLDVGDEPLNDPSCWIKANPLLGVTITKEYLAGVVAQAKAMPGKLNGILRLHFCQWTDAETAWITRETLEPCMAVFDPAMHHGAEVFEGIDLSQARDITAKASVVKTGSVEIEVEVNGELKTVSKPTFDAWIDAWTPGDTLAARALQDKAPYEVWVAQGHLNAPKGTTIRFDHVAQSLADDDRDFEIKAIAYDRYAFRRFEEECDRLGLKLPFVEHPQGGTKKGKPTDAMKEAAEADDRTAEGLWMPGSLRELEDAIYEGRIRLRINPVLISAMMSAVTDEDRWGNRWLAKERSINKIDAVVALCMAIGAAMSMNSAVSVDDWIASIAA